MADYSMKPRDLARKIPALSSIQAEVDDRKLKSATRNRRNERIFEMGQSWQLKGKKLSAARHDVKFEERELTDEEFRYFMNGFMYNLRTYAYSYGKKGIKLENLPEECANDVDFMDSYVRGVGYRLGYMGAGVGDLPLEFMQSDKRKKIILMEYERGIVAREKEFDNESKKRR